MKLNFSYNMVPSLAWIIRVAANEKSCQLAQRCAESCAEVGQPYDFWPAYDGLGNTIVPPAHHNAIMDCIKVTDHYLTRGEVACALSHISLWAKCVLDDQPLVVLEHDAIMVKPYSVHAVFNSICYLGNHEQYAQGWPILPTPTHASEGPNYHFLCRAHAYAIDPASAKNLLAHVIKYGICAPLDIMIRSDIFPAHQIGLYAYNRNDDTSILGRPREGRSTQRNDHLEF